ncbi:glycine cleavage system H protein (lipoate-binding) [Desulfosporosinus orientis DSM 765]|uniref:Glycine cleavage system H protein n=1 Tax=Desulfosporosinus orientis (strain ATCC 19365 / DSM 765 / NCIMB 8382 / VKM B-1628 / Singapore I) TaxID=768706 RepID=G7WJ95_DESOD|nr:glycine cleavage system protein GcvH [Desulfosporosinus orientis]AET69754.1 glycine cleavage system H protein (lipoate-binding) [Desulfosporosinus orientis DSM 765]
MKIGEWDFPEELLYDDHHQWLKREDETVTVGLTDYGQYTRGDILYLSLPEAGAQVKAGEAVGSLETGKWVGRFYAPQTGEICAVNAEVLANTRLINQDPYGQGWLFKMKTHLFEGQLLMSVEQLKVWLDRELEREKACDV